MSNSNELRIFISSTFRDLQEEREHLVKKIFPEIRALCRERGIIFTEVDLRWGITDEQLALGQVIRACLEEVDKCRPYFIGITGSRYGYVPSFLDIQKDPSLLEQYPWIEDAAMDGMSITEMEAEFGLFSPPSDADPPNALFYFRRHRQSFDNDEEPEEELERLVAYQKRIEESGASIERFRDPVSLGEIIFDDLATIVKRDFADAKPPTPLEQEQARHEAFSLSRRRAYIANPTYLKRLNDHVKSDDPPLVVYAESGSGKSSLFAYWAESYRKKNPDAHIIEHYVGIGATSTDHFAIILHLCMEIKERFGVEDDIPTDPKKMETAFGQWLGYAEHALQQSDEKLVLILDGLNQLQGTALNLRWIPDVISPSIRLILSSTVEGTLVELKKRGWNQFGMQALSEAEREAVVVRYLAEYRKALNPEQIKRIASDYKCGHPLFLKTLLEELRLISRHEDLEHRIDEYLEATGTEDLFQKVLERIEEDHGTRAVRDTLSALWCSRSGLDERELSEFTGASRLKITAMVAGLDYHLVRKEGYLTFFHDYLRRAIEKRYVGNEQTRVQVHQRLGTYFENTELNQRNAGERIWQFSQGGDDEKLVATLANPALLHLVFRETGESEVLSEWSRLRDAGHDPEAVYLESIKKNAAGVTAEQLKSWTTAATVLQRLSLWSGAVEINLRALSAAREGGYVAEEARAEAGLGWLSYLRGDYSEATERLDKATHLYEELGDRNGVASAIGSVGTVYKERGEYERALEAYQHQLTISEELGNQKGVASAIGNMGGIYVRHGEHGRALEAFQRQLTIAEELGDRSGVALAVGNMGLVYYRRGEYDRALEAFQRQLTIAEELGDRRTLSHAVGNMGLVYSERGEYDRALEAYQRQLAIAEELGDRRTVSIAVGNMGLVYSARGEYDLALEAYQRQLTIREELGDRNGVALAVGNMGIVYLERGEHDRALEAFQRQLTIGEELGDRSKVSIAVGSTGAVYYRRGEYDRALEAFQRLLTIAEEMGNRRNVSLAVGNMGLVYSARGEYDRALEAYQRQLAIAEELGDRSTVSIAVGNMGLVYSARGEYERALDAFVQAAEEHRSIGVRLGVVHWLIGSARTLLDVATSEDQMPEYLPRFLPDLSQAGPASSGEWRAETLRAAREQAGEAVATSRELSLTDTLFEGRVLLARIDAAEERRDLAVQSLHDLLDEAGDDEERAEARFWLWKVGESEQAASALALYKSLYAKAPRHQYRQRIDELKGAAETS